MADQIIIDVTSDPKDLEHIIDLLERLQQVDKKSADEFRNSNKAYADRKKSVDDLNKSVDNIGKSAKKPIEIITPKQIGLIESAKNRIDQLRQAQEKTNDPQRLQRINTLLEKQAQRMRELQGIKPPTAIRQTQSELEKFENRFKGVAQRLAAFFVIDRVLSFANESVKAFQEAEKAALILKSAVDVNGGLQTDFEELIQQSKELQKITIFSDDTIQRAQTAALQFGLTKDEVQKLIPVVADFASATGQDLQSALDGVLQGINGVGRGLKIYGITIDENGTRQSRLGEITDQLTKKFEGQAEAVGETAFGAAQKYKNELDDIQERLGERLSPILQNVRSLFLDLSDAAISAAEDMGLAASKADSVAGSLQALIDKAATANRAQVDEFKKQFQSLDISELEDKFESAFALSRENANKAKESTGIEAALFRNLSKEFANQAQALSELLQLKRKGIDVTDAETKALEQLLDISKLSNQQLEALLKTFNTFNSTKSSDAIDLINKELEARAKANKKTVDDREQALAKLHEIEQRAFEENLSDMAKEINKILQIEQEKNIRLNELVSQFSKATGAKLNDVLAEFDKTGRIDLSKVFSSLENFKAPTGELEKFNKAVQDILQKFDRISNAAILEKNIKSLVDSLTDSFNAIDNLVTQTSDNIEKEFADKKTKVTLEFEQTGDRSEGGVKAFNDKLVELDNEKEGKIIANQVNASEQKLANAKKTNEQIARLDEKKVVDTSKLEKQITEDHKKEGDQRQKDAEARINREIELEKQRQQAIQEIKQRLIELSHTLVDTISAFYNNYYTKQSEQIQRNLDEKLDTYDTELEENERLHSDEERGDREYENKKQALLDKRKKEEQKADKELRKIKHEQAILNRNIAILNATLYGIEGVARAFADYAYPYDLIVAGIVGALAAAEVAAAASTPIPALAKGTEKVTGKGTETSDSVPARLSVGERVTSASTNKKYFPILSAIHHERLSPDSLNYIARMTPEQVNRISTTKISERLTETNNNIFNNLSKEEIKMLSLPNLGNKVAPTNIRFRTDLAPLIKQRQEQANNNSTTNIEYRESLDEHGVARALQRGTPLTEASETRLAKKIGREVRDSIPSNYGRAWK